VHPLGADFTGLQDFQPQTLDEQTALSYTAQVPPSLMEEIYLTGTPDEIIEQAAVWRDHGVRYAVVVNASAMQPSLRKGMASTLPFAAIRPSHARASEAVNLRTPSSEAGSMGTSARSG
jgi:phthiodiolone/phenolphthiodiolone dimycocerosates ketoreductase